MALKVAEGKSICCGKKGIMGPGATVDAAILGGEANVKRLIEKGVLVDDAKPAPKAKDKDK